MSAIELVLAVAGDALVLLELTSAFAALTAPFDARQGVLVE
jgi:hypothetical protein